MAVVWDTIYASIIICKEALIPLSQHDCRFRSNKGLNKRRPPYGLKCYPNCCLIFLAIMANCSQLIHPSAFTIHALQSTYTRIVDLNNIVSLSQPVLWQFHKEHAHKTGSLLPSLNDYFEESYYDAKDDSFGYGDHSFDSYSHKMGGDFPDTDSAIDCSGSVGSNTTCDITNDMDNNLDGGAFFHCWETATH